MNTNFMEVVQHVSEYYKEHLPKYTPFEVRRQSYNTEDDYLYMVSSKKDDGTYAVHTSWNESTKSLNHGHYNLPNMEACIKVMEEYQNGSLYEESSTPLEVLQELLVKNDDNFDNSCDEVLYITGFVDGVNAQYGNKWDKLTDTEINTLLAEAVEV